MQANQRNIPILTDAEKLREGLDDLLYLSDYVVCSTTLPQAWTEAPTVPTALVSMLLRLPKVKFVIVTLGADGCIMLERSAAGENDQAGEMDVVNLVELLKQKIDSGKTTPTCVSSDITRLQAKGVGSVCGRIFLGTAEKIPESELVDTTGAGDAFIGAILYGMCIKHQIKCMKVEVPKRAGRVTGHNLSNYSACQKWVGLTRKHLSKKFRND